MGVVGDGVPNPPHFRGSAQYGPIGNETRGPDLNGGNILELELALPRPMVRTVGT